MNTKKLVLKKSKFDGLLIGTKSDGTKYSVRTDRRRYFFPDEWIEFISQFKNKEHKFFFITLLHTGARIMEALNLKYEDINTERNSINFKIVKQRKAKKNFYAIGKSRGFFVSNNYIKEYKSFIRNKKINNNEYIFLDNSKLPQNYDSLDNNEKKQYYTSKTISYSNMLKRKLKKTTIKDWYNFSPHNIRKTYGMWMRTFNIEMAELCYRLGHDMDTFMAHYGSSLIFTDSEKRKIFKIMGDVK
jgi:integrase|tara:strand:- start:5852 stop:6583 length:732 start_codon:yes stop_codon:yes gene_type:complete